MIERKPFPGKKSEGRWAHYFLVIDGNNYGTVERINAVGSDRLAGRAQPRYDAWSAGGRQMESQAKAERHLVGRELTVLNPTFPEDVVRAALAQLED